MHLSAVTGSHSTMALAGKDTAANGATNAKIAAGLGSATAAQTGTAAGNDAAITAQQRVGTSIVSRVHWGGSLSQPTQTDASQPGYAQRTLNAAVLAQGGAGVADWTASLAVAEAK